MKKYVDEGDVVVLTAGIPSTNVQGEKHKASNMMRIAVVSP